MPRAHPAAVKQLALTLMLQGFGLPDIAQKLNLSVYCVKAWANRGQWRLIRSQVQEDANKAATIAASHANTDASKRIRSDLAEEIQEQVAALRKYRVKSNKELANTGGKQGRAAVVKTLIEAASTVHGWGDEAKAGLIVPMIGREPAIEISTEPVNNPAEVVDTATSSVPAIEDNPIPPSTGQVPGTEPVPDRAN